jgi:hypothetical protein
MVYAPQMVNSKWDKCDVVGVEGLYNSLRG